MEIRTKRDGTKVYREKIYINSKQIKSPSFTRLSDVKQWKARVLTERSQTWATGLNYNPSIKFGDFSKKWLDEKVRVRNSPRTYDVYNSAIEIYLKPLLQDIPIGQVSHNHVNSLINQLKGKGRANKTTNKIINILKTILNDAVKWNYLAKSPLFAFKDLKENPKRFTYWTTTEIAQFLRSNLNNELYPLYVTVLNTGLRLGEALGLCWDRVNLPQSQIEITRTVTRYGLQETTKTHEKRILPINDAVRGVLLSLTKKQRNKQFVFATKDGLPLDYEHLSRKYFKKAQKDAGITNSIRFHDLRHTYASQFMMYGGDIFTLQKLLGHKSMDMTMKYAHLSPKYLSEAANVVCFKGQLEENSPNTVPEKEKQPKVVGF